MIYTVLLFWFFLPSIFQAQHVFAVGAVAGGATSLTVRGNKAAFAIGQPLATVNSNQVTVLRLGMPHLAPVLSSNWPESNLADTTFQIEVFPNPASELLTIKLPRELSDFVMLKLYTLNGVKVFERGFYAPISANRQISIVTSNTNLASGSYLLQLQDQGGQIPNIPTISGLIFARRVVIQK